MCVFILEVGIKKEIRKFYEFQKIKEVFVFDDGLVEQLGIFFYNSKVNFGGVDEF